jgi:hypothetical protein
MVYLLGGTLSEREREMDTTINAGIIKNVLLEKTRLNCAKLIDVRVSSSNVASMLSYELRAFIFSEQLKNIRRECQYPVDWWQALKQRWFLPFMLKRWPVKMQKHIIDIDFKALYPELTAKISIPDTQSVLKYCVKEDNFPKSKFFKGA